MDGSPLNSVKPSPRVTLAAQLYATGAAPTKKSASEMAGLHPNYLTMLRNNPAVQGIIEDTQMRVSDESVSASALIQSLSREAIETIAGIMRNSGSDALKLKAAVDLADRAPETSKIQKHAVAAFSLDSVDAKDLARALVEAAGVQKSYSAVATASFVKVNQEVITGPVELPLKGEIEDGLQGSTAGEGWESEAADEANAPKLEVPSALDAQSSGREQQELLLESQLPER